MDKQIVAIDTEFERKHTYRPILSIVQVRFENEEPIIYDVYKKKNEQLVDLLEILSNDDIIKVIHCARQDVEAIYYRFHIPIQNIFDTQIACKYLMKTKNEISYAKAVECICGKQIIKEKTLQTSNWLKRPLTEEQIKYAKQDVEYLHEIYNITYNALKNDKTMFKNFKQECSFLEDEKLYSFNPQLFWQKIRHKFINNPNYSLIKELFILREKLAFKVNIPREFAIKSYDLIDYANTGDKQFLNTNKKIHKYIFTKMYKKYQHQNK